jgi:hypothetical protein
VKQQIARVQKDEVFDLFPNRADVGRFSWQTAKLIGFSPTGLGLAEQIVAVYDSEISGRGGRIVLAVGNAQKNEKDRQDYRDVGPESFTHRGSPVKFLPLYATGGRLSILNASRPEVLSANGRKISLE